MDYEGDTPSVQIAAPKAAAAPVLTPTEYSPWAQWSFDLTQTPTQYRDDRTPNARKLSGNANLIFPPDLRGPATNSIAFPPNSSGIYTDQIFGTGTLIDGPFTFCGRAWRSQNNSGGMPLVTADGYKVIWCESDGTLSYTPYPYGSPTSLSHLVVPQAQWFWWSIRRASLGATTVRMQLNGVFEDVGVAVATAVGYTRVSVGVALSFSGAQLVGGLGDVSAWDSVTSDADLERYRHLSMGV